MVALGIDLLPFTTSIGSCSVVGLVISGDVSVISLVVVGVVVDVVVEVVVLVEVVS